MSDVRFDLIWRNRQAIITSLETVKALLDEIEGKHPMGSFERTNLRPVTTELSKMQSIMKNISTYSGIASKAFSGIGTSMKGVSKLFGGSVLNVVGDTITRLGTVAMTGAMEGTVQRYDIMKKFPLIMSNVFGETTKVKWGKEIVSSAEASKKAIDELEKSVIGLPTGLDEIVESAQEIIPLVGDIEKGTRLTIATNNALIASGSDSQSQNYARRQIKDLLSKGKLRSQEWESLFTGLGASLGPIAEQLGYKGTASKKSPSLKAVNEELDALQTKLASIKKKKLFAETEGDSKNIEKYSKQIEQYESRINSLNKHQKKFLGDFRADLKSGKISAEDFLDALEKAGGKGSKLEQRAAIYKDTINAVTQNIRNALNKLGASALDTLDTILQEGTGKSLTETIIDISDSIKDKLIPALEDWGKNHKDDILEFVQRLKDFDWVGLASKVGTNISKIIDFMSKFYSLAPTGVFAASMTWLSPLGSVFNGLGSFFGTISDLAGFIASAKILKKLETVVKTAGAAGAAGAAIPKLLKPLNIKSSFARLGLTAGYVGVIGELGLVIAEYGKIAEYISNIKLGKNYGEKMQTVAELIAGSGAVVTAVVGIGTALSASGVGAGAVGLGELLSAGFFGIIGEVGIVMGKYVDIIAKIGEMEVPKADKFTKLKGTIKSVFDVIGEIASDTFGGASFNVRKVEDVSKATEHLVAMAESIKTLNGIKVGKDASGKIDRIKEVAEKVLSLDLPEGEQDSATIRYRLQNVAKSMASIESVAESIKAVKKNLKGLSKDDFNAIDEKVSGMMEACLNILGSVAGTSSKRTGRASKAMTVVKDTSQVSTNASNIASGMASVGEIVTSMLAINEQLPKIAEIPEDNYTALDKMLDSLYSMFVRLNQFDLSKYVIGNADAFSSGMESIKKAINKVPTVLEKAKEIQDIINSGAIALDENGNWLAGKTIKSIMDSLFGNAAQGTEILDGKLDNGIGQFQAKADAMGTVANALKKIAKFGDSASASLKAVYEIFKKLLGYASKHSTDLDSTASALGKIKNNSEGIGGSLITASLGISALGNACASNKDSVGQMASSIAKLSNALNEMPKSVNVNFGGVFGNAVGSAIDSLFSNGGVVYRANGGSLFKPRGTDTVPAMLTPGEFVMRRRAVSAFGANFMNRINNLDVDGAIRALTIKAGSRVFGRSFVTNYNRDNHATVNQNIYNASQNYSQRRASRWARALV